MSKKKKVEKWLVLVKGDNIESPVFDGTCNSKKDALCQAKSLAQDCYDNGDDDIEAYVVRVTNKVTVEPNLKVEDY